MLALLGRNGVGKTTLMRVLIGLLAADRRQRRALTATRLTGLPPHRDRPPWASRYVPQGRGIFPKLTVRENLLVGGRAAPGAAAACRSRRSSSYSRSCASGSVRPAARCRAASSRCWRSPARCAAGPKVLLLDEPSEGIQPNIVHAIGRADPPDRREHGLAVLLVEQNLDFALSAASRCVIMEKGRIVHEGGPGRASETMRF